MAPTGTSKLAPVKQLKEHLQEQQEPFKLSTYLTERRYSLKKFSSHSENNRGSITSRTNLKEPCSSSLRKSTILHSPRTLKSLLYKFITPNNKQELSSCNKAVKEKLVSETIDMIQQIAETNWFSAVSNIKPYSASSESNYGGLEHGDVLFVAEASQVLNVIQSEEEQTDTDIQKPWSCKEDDKQFSSVTRLQDETSVSEKYGQVRFTEVKETVHSGSSRSQRDKSVLAQTRWLLLDCIKRIIIRNVRNERQKHLHKLLSPEELGKIISEQLCTLGKQLVNATSATRSTNLGFSSTTEECNYFHKTKLQIYREMGDSIIDQLLMK